ncbi:MAG TPA: HAD-IC family P-type ATPase [Pseudolysinimonas sp.]|nr:HAD-IC family P-type ATPase [Pseudolysinimonas sp.]
MVDDSGRSFARILAANVFTVFNGVVGGCFILLLALGAWQDALFGFFVIANTVIGVVQEFLAKRTLARLAVLNSPRAAVLRNGLEVECAVEDVVIGDTLVLRPGDQLAADATLIESHEIEVDQSLLTGEADPVTPKTGQELLSGSVVLAGSGTARAIRVGADSYAARTTSEARQFSLVRSELRRSIGRIIVWLSLALVPIMAIVVNGQVQAAGGWSVVFSNGAWRGAAITSVASIIATVPAGLVFMTSVALAVGAVRLARRRVLVRELAAVEGLARVDMLCIDKTGTLTEGTMTLDRVDVVEHPAPGWQSAVAWLAADPAANATARALARDFGPALAVGEKPDAVVPFSSRYKWSGAHFASGPSAGSWVLGGADIVLADSGPGARARGQAAALASAGERTLVLAHTLVPIPHAEPSGPRLPRGLQPVAVIALGDRVRRDAGEILRYFADQGVEVCVLSGDDPGTVAAVAHAVGLPLAGPRADARDLPSDPPRLADVLRTQRVFGRVTPEQKKAVILSLQSLGHTVAMIGDGVNDTLALKHADLGIAMGSGTAAARSVAQIVLLDGSFARLPHVVAEGRRVIANVERLAKLFLSKTVYALVLALGFGLLLWPFPFLPRQLSVVDGLTIGLPALVLALLPNSRRSRRGFLRRAVRFCVPSGLIIAGALLAVTAYASAGTRASSTQVHTVAVITLTLSALWVLVVLARPFTRATAAVVVGAYAGLVLIVAVPFSRDFLALSAPAPELIVVAVAVSAGASVALELIHRGALRRARTAVG